MKTLNLKKRKKRLSSKLKKLTRVELLVVDDAGG
jgi:DNA replication protein DnaC